MCWLILQNLGIAREPYLKKLDHFTALIFKFQQSLIVQLRVLFCSSQADDLWRSRSLLFRIPGQIRELERISISAIEEGLVCSNRLFKHVNITYGKSKFKKKILNC